ncbi:hypothetical protein PG988_016181 [Apiospora saccharicola]
MDGTVFTRTPIGGTGAVDTFWLPPQTTPFTPSGYGRQLSCEPSIGCNNIGECWPSGCTTSCTPKWITTWPPSSASVDATRPECFPTGYYSIGSHLDVAYPGTACMSGWHSACATKFGFQGHTYSQIWCCPAGEFKCLATETTANSTMRACVSTGLNPREYDPLFAPDGYGDPTAITTIVYPTLPTGKGVLYKIDAIPLQIPPKTTSSLLPLTTVSVTASIDYGPRETAASDPADEPRQLSKGSIAGAISGSILGALIVAATIFVCIRRRRRSRSLQASDPGVMDRVVDPYCGKPELPTDDAVRAELNGYGTCHEMDGSSQPVEALTPAPYTTDLTTEEISTKEEIVRPDRKEDREHNVPVEK